MAKQQNLNDLPVHPAAELFPMMSEPEFELMKEDIRVNGQNDDVLIWDGQLLDGRNRLRACTELGIEPGFMTLPKAIDPVAWVLSHNLHRRHLDTAQRAMVADKLATLRNGENKKQASGIPLAQTSQVEAAEKLHVSVDSVKKARKVRARASKKVIAAVERGEMSLNAALETTKKSEAEKAAKEKAKADKLAEKELKKKELAAEREKKKAEAAAAKEKAKADAKIAKAKAKEEAAAAKLAARPTGEQAALIRNMIQQHIDKAVRLLDDLHRIRPNHAVRSVSVKALQGIKMW